ncbi:MAG: TlpA disulfide reductase family protein [Bacteroidota bacterium]
MKKAIVLSFAAILFMHPVSAQGNLNTCNNERKRQMGGITPGPDMDQETMKKLSRVNTDWLKCAEGKTIPYFKERTLAGEKINAGVLAGKVLVINFWFVACSPCVAEIPALNKLVTEYKNENVRFLSVTHDQKWTVTDFLKSRPFNFDIIYNAAFTTDEFGVASFPTTFVIDQNGKIVKAWMGGSTGPDANEQAYTRIKPVLDELLRTVSH